MDKGNLEETSLAKATQVPEKFEHGCHFRSIPDRIPRMEQNRNGDQDHHHHQKFSHRDSSLFEAGQIFFHIYPLEAIKIRF